jgi:hypothetical protein
VLRSKGRVTFDKAVSCFGDDLVCINATRTKGSRPLWQIINLLWDDDGSVHAILTHCDKSCMITHRLAGFSGHMVARLLQRTIGSNDVNAVRDILKRATMFILAGFDDIAESPSGDIELAMRDGCLLGVTDGYNEVLFKTWVNADSASNPRICQDCSESGENYSMRLFPLAIKKAE